MDSKSNINFNNILFKYFSQKYKMKRNYLISIINIVAHTQNIYLFCISNKINKPNVIINYNVFIKRFDALNFDEITFNELEEMVPINISVII